MFTLLRRGPESLLSSQRRDFSPPVWPGLQPALGLGRTEVWCSPQLGVPVSPSSSQSSVVLQIWYFLLPCSFVQIRLSLLVLTMLAD